MKKVLLGSVATGALVAAGGVASAADLAARPALKAPPMVAPPVPVFSWTGCYVGGHTGWGWGQKDASSRVTHATFGSGTANRTETADTSGSVFGGQIGCDYQFAGNWVLGIEGSLSGSRMEGVSSDPFDPHDSSEFLRFKTDRIATLTGRLGFTGWIPQTLLYIRGGAAWARDVFDFQHADESFARGVFNQNRTGWTIGGGIEYAFLPNWSVFAEYDHYDFGTKNVAFYSGSSCGGCLTTESLDVKQTIDELKFGINYRFNVFGIGKAPLGIGKSPVVARY